MKRNTKKTSRAPTARRRASSYRYPLTVDEAENERFAETLRDWDGLARAARAEGKPLIGMLGEKSMHSILKRFLAPDESCHEIPIRGKNGEDGHRYVADVLVDRRIYEIQTGSFFPLVQKLSYYLSETDYDVTVVHPIPAVRYKVWIDPETGEIESRKRSPKRGCAEDALPEIFWLRELIRSPRLHILLLMLEEEEYRYLDGWSRDKKRGSNRCERVPAALLGAVRLDTPGDYRAFLKPELPVTFTASELGALFGYRGRAVYSALKVLIEVGLVEQIGMRGRSALYRRTDLEADVDTVSVLEEIESEELFE